MVSTRSRVEGSRVPRRSRLHIPNGVYYITLCSNPGRHIFSNASDYEELERYVTNALISCRTSAYAFVWQPDAARLLVHISDIQVGRFVQRLTSQYARNVHKERGGSGHLFQQRYHARLIEPEVYLLRIIRHLHLLPLAEGATNGIESSRLSSHSAYQGSTSIDWLTKVIELPGTAYDKVMKAPPTPGDAMLFEHGSKWDPRVVGSKDWLKGELDRALIRKAGGDLDQLIDTISLQIGVDREALMSKSRKRELALARAVVAWHSIARGICTLAEIARKLRRDPSTLFVGMTRYRMLRPELFK